MAKLLLMVLVFTIPCHAEELAKSRGAERPDLTITVVESADRFLAEVRKAGGYVLGRDGQFYYLALPSSERVIPAGVAWRFWPWERLMMVRSDKLSDDQVRQALDQQEVWDDAFQLAPHPELLAFMEGRQLVPIRKSAGVTAGPLMNMGDGKPR